MIICLFKSEVVAKSDGGYFYADFVDYFHSNFS